MSTILSLAFRVCEEHFIGWWWDRRVTVLDARPDWSERKQKIMPAVSASMYQCASRICHAPHDEWTSKWVRVVMGEWVPQWVSKWGPKWVSEWASECDVVVAVMIEASHSCMQASHHHLTLSLQLLSTCGFIATRPLLAAPHNHYNNQLIQQQSFEIKSPADKTPTCSNTHIANAAAAGGGIARMAGAAGAAGAAGGWGGRGELVTVWAVPERGGEGPACGWRNSRRIIGSSNGPQTCK